jgi:hypothetical protein
LLAVVMVAACGPRQQAASSRPGTAAADPERHPEPAPDGSVETLFAAFIEARGTLDGLQELSCSDEDDVAFCDVAAFIETGDELGRLLSNATGSTRATALRAGTLGGAVARYLAALEAARASAAAPENAEARSRIAAALEGAELAVTALREAIEAAVDTPRAQCLSARAWAYHLWCLLRQEADYELGSIGAEQDVLESLGEAEADAERSEAIADRQATASMTISLADAVLESLSQPSVQLPAVEPDALDELGTDHPSTRPALDALGVARSACLAR